MFEASKREKIQENTQINARDLEILFRAVLPKIGSVFGDTVYRYPKYRSKIHQKIR